MSHGGGGVSHSLPFLPERALGMTRQPLSNSVGTSPCFYGGHGPGDRRLSSRGTPGGYVVMAKVSWASSAPHLSLREDGRVEGGGLPKLTLRDIVKPLFQGQVLMITAVAGDPPCHANFQD